MSKDLKSPSQQPVEPNRGKQLEEPARVYVDLASGAVCMENYEQLPNFDVPDPAVRVTSKKLANVSTTATMIGQQK